MAAIRTADRDADGLPKWLPSRWLWNMYGDDEDATEAEQAFDYYATLERIAVTRQQITAWDLPTRPTKKTDSRSKSFKGPSVELDAIPPAKLRQFAEQVIEPPRRSPAVEGAAGR